MGHTNFLKLIHAQQYNTQVWVWHFNEEQHKILNVLVSFEIVFVIIINYNTIKFLLDDYCLQSKGLFTPWTMKLFQGLVKFCDWLLNSSRDHFGFYQGKNVKVTMKSRSPKDIFEGLHYPLTWSNAFCSGRGKKGGMVEKGKGHGREISL